MTLLFTLTACIISVIAYWQYYADLRNSNVKSNRYSWLIWSLSMSLETITFSYVSGDIIKSISFIISAIACIIITVKVWQSSTRNKPDTTEMMSLAFCAGAMLFWIFFQSAWLAHVVLLVSIPIGFIPAYKAAFADYKTENSRAWYLWVISDLIVLTIITGRLQSFQELPYIIIEFLCHAMIVAIVVIGKLKSSNNKFIIKLNSLGKSVYAAKKFSKGSVILKFGGEIVSEEAIKEKLGSRTDYYLQVSHERYLGPSGEADDYVNHSCNPNSGLVFDGRNIILVAIKNIDPDTEITWDYSTSSFNTSWKMKCSCNDPLCRQEITGFEHLDKKIQAKYLELGIVAPFINHHFADEKNAAIYKVLSPGFTASHSYFQWPALMRQKKLAGLLLPILFSFYALGL